MNAIKVKICSECKNTFDCGDSPDGSACWCNAFPPIFEIEAGKDCLCSSCLKKNSLQKINDFVSKVTAKNAINNRAANLPKSSTLIEEIDYYIENDNYVFTAWYHLKRGSCCGNGCRHCPY